MERKKSRATQRPREVQFHIPGPSNDVDRTINRRRCYQCYNHNSQTSAPSTQHQHRPTNIINASIRDPVKSYQPQVTWTSSNVACSYIAEI